MSENSIWSRVHRMAEEAVRLIYQNLKAAYDNGQDKEARSGM